MKKHFTDDGRNAAVARMLAGESPSALSRELGVTTSCLRNWRAARKATVAPVAPLAPQPVQDAPATPLPPKAPDGLAEALAAAGAPLPTSEPAPSGLPLTDAVPTDGPMTVADLIAGVHVVNDVVADGVAMAVGVTLSDDVRERVTSISPKHERLMHALGEQALPYVNASVKQFPQYMALGFAVVVGFVFIGTGRKVAALADDAAPEGSSVAGS